MSDECCARTRYEVEDEIKQLSEDLSERQKEVRNLLYEKTVLKDNLEQAICLLERYQNEVDSHDLWHRTQELIERIQNESI